MMTAIAAITVAATVPASSQNGFPLTITDAAGVEHTFETPPNLGCIWSGCTEILADLNVPLYAGGSEEGIFFAPAGPPTHSIEDEDNPEHWIAVETDVIFTRVPFGTWSDQLREFIPIFHLHHPSYGESSQTGYQAYIENLRLVGQLTGENEAAEAAIARFDNMVANLKELATDETAEIEVAAIWASDESDEYWSIGTVNPFCVLIVEIGIGKCTPNEDIGEIEMNAEAFLKLDPEWILYMNGGSENRDDPVWKRLSAVQNGQVVDAGDRIYCCSTRGFIHAMQEYAHFVIDETIPAPGKLDDFDPTQSPLVTSN